MNESFDYGLLLRNKWVEGKPFTEDEIKTVEGIQDFIRGFYGDFAGIFNENLLNRLETIRRTAYQAELQRLRGK